MTVGKDKKEACPQPCNNEPDSFFIGYGLISEYKTVSKAVQRVEAGLAGAPTRRRLVKECLYECRESTA